MNKYRFTKILALGLFLFCASFSLLAQEDGHFLNLKSGSYFIANNTALDSGQIEFNPDELINGELYRIVHFENTPTSQQKEELQKVGFTLLSYLPKRFFYVSISATADISMLKTYNATAIAPVQSEYKLSKALFEKKYPDWTLINDNEIGLNAIYFENINSETAYNSLTKIGAQNIESFNGGFRFQIAIELLPQLYSLPVFYYFEELNAPETPESYVDVHNHRSNYINNPSVIGTQYDGTGVTIMMQDDGPIGPHIDYQGRTTDSTFTDNGNHGDHVAGIIMGAGNLDPNLIGNAPGAHLLVYTSNNDNYNSVPYLYETQDLVITSKSYGDGNNAGYTILSRTLDQQSREKDALVHVFSAGNSGTADYGYGAGAGWGNITGGHKQGKNVIAVGNLSYVDALSSSSSRGPADDGRIKPDICAVGTNVNSTIDVNDYEVKSGTSMACPGVAGSLALLYQAYRDLNNGQNPPAALMKAFILNTAEDLGNPGPDFRFGWGRINIRRAYLLLANNQSQFGEITQGDAVTHTITVPANTKQLRVMIYWTDYEASPIASTALVNDLNMTMVGPDANSYLPWVLNSTPNAGLLNQDAAPGIDDLNNVEQITIDDPLQGIYSINIEGFDIPEGPQKYYVVYEFVPDEIVITYPIGGESFVPSTQEMIRWDATGTSDNFLVEYSADNGLSWNQIVGAAPGTWRNFPWTVPSSLVSGQCKVRITRGTQITESSKVFSIIDQPDNLNIEWACPNAFNFSWDSISGATGYEVFLLGEKYMDSAGFTITTNATVYANSMQTQWVSVRAVGPNGIIGKRAIALEKSIGTFGCSMDPPIANFSAICTETGSGSCIKFYDNSINAGQGAAWEWTFEGGTPSTSNQENPKICYDNEGVYSVQLIVKNGVAEDTLIYTQFINIIDGLDLPFEENFESSFTPSNWVLSPDENGKNWQVYNGTSAYNQGQNCFHFDNFVNNPPNGISSFQTEQYDLSDKLLYDLSFDVAYAPGLSSNDTLYVYATNDCGDEKTLLYKMGGLELSTALATGEFFIPTSSEWRREIADIQGLTGYTSVSFIFENHSSAGNVLYLDNINIQISEANFSANSLTVFPNPFTNELNISGLIESEEVELWIVDANGKRVVDLEFIAWEGLIKIPVDHLAAGVYIIKIFSPSKNHKQKLVKIK